MKVIQELVAYFDRSRKAVAAAAARAARTELNRHRRADEHARSMREGGRHLLFPRHGRIRGPAMGHRYYSGDSTIGAAAVHAGLLKPGETDLLRVTVVTPPEKFPGTLRNGVTSTEYGRYQYAWRLSAI